MYIIRTWFSCIARTASTPCTVQITINHRHSNSEALIYKDILCMAADISFVEGLAVVTARRGDTSG